MSADLAHIRQIMAEADCLFTEAEVEAAIDKVASQINTELVERNPVVFWQGVALVLGLAVVVLLGLRVYGY